MAEFKKLINPPIKASEINSESATNGQVLTANGTGGASWIVATSTFYLHTIVTSNHTFYIVTNGKDEYILTNNLMKKAFLDSIAYNKWIGTGGFNNKFVFGISIGIENSGSLTPYYNSPTAFQKGNALSYYDNNGNEITISRSDFGSFVSDTVTPLKW